MAAAGRSDDATKQIDPWSVRRLSLSSSGLRLTHQETGVLYVGFGIVGSMSGGLTLFDPMVISDVGLDVVLWFSNGRLLLEPVLWVGGVHWETVSC